MMYRVWDNANQKWLGDSDGLLLTPEGKLYTSKKSLFGKRKLAKVEDYTLHKATGFNDIVGFEIYEGDVIEIHDANDKDKILDIAVVVFDDDLGIIALTVDATDDGENYYWQLSYTSCSTQTKVISDIFIYNSWKSEEEER